MLDLSFGITLRGSDSPADFRELIARADGLGCDIITAPDHLGAADPFATLAAVAQLTSRPRLRTYVLNVGFWNPALLARAAATTDLLSAGRLELGLGAGHMRSEHEEAGLPWTAHAGRIERLQATVTEVTRRLGDPAHRPRPAQSRVPIVVGAMTSPGLAVAAAHADIVAFAGLLQIPGRRAGTFAIASMAETEARVAEVRRLAGGRAYRSDVLLQAIVIGQQPAAAAEDLAATIPTVTAEALLDTPFVLLARDRSHAAELLAERRERLGVDCFTAHQPYLDALGEVIAAHRG